MNTGEGSILGLEPKMRVRIPLAALILLRTAERLLKANTANHARSTNHENTK